MAKVLMKGNEAMALAAIKAGLDAFYGYPITPQNELPEYLSKAMPANGRAFVQAESEVAAINMVYGAAGAGARPAAAAEHRCFRRPGKSSCAAHKTRASLGAAKQHDAR